MLYPFNAGALEISARMSAVAGFKVALAHALRRQAHLRSAYLAWKTYIDGISVHMIATKPATAAVTEPSVRSRATNGQRLGP
jgi:hypothetical protein